MPAIINHPGVSIAAYPDLLRTLPRIVGEILLRERPAKSEERHYSLCHAARRYHETRRDASISCLLLYARRAAILAYLQSNEKGNKNAISLITFCR